MKPPPVNIIADYYILVKYLRVRISQYNVKTINMELPLVNIMADCYILVKYLRVRISWYNVKIINMEPPPVNIIADYYIVVEEQSTTTSLKIDLNFSVSPNFNSIILCVYYSCSLITFNYKEKNNNFHGLTIKTKIILGLKLASNTSSHNFVCAL